MKRNFFCLLICLCVSAESFAQDLKPCGTSVLARNRLKGEASSGALVRQRIRRTGSDVPYIGDRRGLIILVDFPDQHFRDSVANETWTAIANTRNYTDNGATGSVSDYFRDQSYDQFRLTFDVVGPVQAQHDYAYYGDNKDWGDPTGWFDQNVGELVEEACRGVADKVRFADYDWDGDGEVEEVYILYAGHGENDYWSKDSTVIWPHMGRLSVDWEGYEDGLVLQGVRIDTYACSNEISRSGGLAGMGTICHEFSHCLGLPDLYNTEEGTSVLGRYDLMDQGNYNGNSWCPVGYSSYERYACGWLSPLTVDELEQVGLLLPLHRSPDVRICRISPEANDYYLIEYREQASWDRYIPKSGFLAWHIDYDENAWQTNTVNNDPDHLRVEWMTLDETPMDIEPLVSDAHPVALLKLAPHIYLVRYADGSVRKVILPH